MDENPEPSVSGFQRLKATVKIENTEEEFTNINRCSIKPDVSDCLQSPLVSDKKKTSSSPAQSSAPTRKSPEPTCAICLEPLQSKAFTDSCFHAFCYTCLREWSKVKPECPLCKQSFTSIVYNVRSIEDYDQYHVMPSNPDSSWQGTDGRRFRYSTTLTTERLAERRLRSNWLGELMRQSDLQMHRSFYAPHSVTLHANTVPENPPPPSQTNRHRIYEDDLWSKKPTDLTRVRCSLPSFYRQNPACTHRLIPWLNRELAALLYNSETRVMFVLDLILALIMSYDIRSSEFYLHMQPYLGNRTRHFVHEFFNFASSPLDMNTYDESAVYEPHNSHNDTVDLSSPDSAVAHVSSTTNHISSTPSTSGASKKKKTQKKRSKRTVTKLYLKRDQENNLWNISSSSSLAFTQPNGFIDIVDITNNLVPSTSRQNSVIVSPTTPPDVSTVRDDSSESESECFIVDCVRPRTPELVDLVSDGEEKNKSNENNSETIHFNKVDSSNGLSMLLQASKFANDEPVPSTSYEMPHKYNKISNGLLNNSSSSGHSSKIYKNHPMVNGNAYDAQSSSESDYCDRWSLSSHSSEPSTTISTSTLHINNTKSKQTNSTCHNNDYYSDSTDISDSKQHKKHKQRTQVKKLRSVIGSVKNDFCFNLKDPNYHSSHSKKHKMKHKKKHKHEKQRPKSTSHSREER